VLLVASAALKCAQLPFHGWLIQVMEAPTPVSALLHAGVVNIGGFLMIRLAPLMTQSEIAQTLLVICGCTTAVIAALVMTTRVSIKVALAWSTCAQMGFMLLECGLGAYPLALLHIVAHSWLQSAFVPRLGLRRRTMARGIPQTE
jgi:NAD(P)H-quinone oxidoreductase subunit 5